MKLQKWIAICLSVITVSSFAACGGLFQNASSSDVPTSSTPSSEQKPVVVETITIPDVTVDLVAPENKVQVPADEKSEMFDANGNKLTAKQWLLNSKFSKSYIQSLGVGEYTFTYKSATKTGTVKLIITDNAQLDYVFLGQVPEMLTYMEQIQLPVLVKNQDSYQEVYEPTYSLTKDGEAIEYVTVGETFQTNALMQGDYQWIATVGEGERAKTFSQSFYVQSFEEYELSKRNELLYSNQMGAYIPYEDGKYFIDLSNNGNMVYFPIDWEVTDKAITAGKTRAEFKLTTNTWFCERDTNGDLIVGEHAGSMWVTNSWKGYNIGCSGKDNKVDNCETNESYPLISNIEVDDKGTADESDDTYTYIIVAFLKRAYFNIAQPLELSFAYGCNVQADLEITFM